MLKLLKYEFRKARTSLITLLSITGALELYFLLSMQADSEEHLFISIFLLMFCAFAAAIFVMIRSISTYSDELKDRSGYLLFLTPNSSVKIVGSKFLYTFANSLLFFALFSALTALDVRLLLGYLDEYEEFMREISAMLDAYGVPVSQILWYALFFVAFGFLSILSTAAVVYLSITVSHTLFRDKKWRWLPSLGLFFLLNSLINNLNTRLTEAVSFERFAAVERTFNGMRSVNTTGNLTVHVNVLSEVMIPALLPVAAVSAAVILISLLSCAWMLDKKVSL